MIAIDPEVVWELAPNAVSVYRQAFVHANASLLPFDILSNTRRLTHFLAQGLHESAGMTRTTENLNYRAERLMEVWPTRFRTLSEAKPYARNPRALANKVYGGRLGNLEPNDGWRFIGRGLIQITGRANYQRVGRVLGLDLVKEPEKVAQAEYILPCAGAIWLLSGGNEAADLDDVRKVTRAINGGYIGLLDRERWLRKVRLAFGVPDVMEA